MRTDGITVGVGAGADLRWEEERKIERTVVVFRREEKGSDEEEGKT